MKTLLQHFLDPSIQKGCILFISFGSKLSYQKFGSALVRDWTQEEEGASSSDHTMRKTNPF
jgi:hypothetical protein